MDWRLDARPAAAGRPPRRQPAASEAGRGEAQRSRLDQIRLNSAVQTSGNEQRCSCAGWTMLSIWMQTTGAILVAINGAARYVCRCLPKAAVVRIGCCISLLYGGGRREQERASISTWSPQGLHPASVSRASAGARPATHEHRERGVRGCSWSSLRSAGSLLPGLGMCRSEVISSALE